MEVCHSLRVPIMVKSGITRWMGDVSMPFTREMGHVISWPRGNLGELCKRYALQLSATHAVLTTTHAEVTIADNNLLIIEAAMELSCFLVVAAVAASYTLVAITHA